LGPDAEILAVAEALQGLRLTIPLDDRPLAHLAEVVRSAVRDATSAAVPRLRDQGPAAVTIEAIDGDNLELTDRVPLSVATVMEQAYVVLIAERAAQTLVMPTGGTAFAIGGHRLAVIELGYEAQSVA